MRIKWFLIKNILIVWFATPRLNNSHDRIKHMFDICTMYNVYTNTTNEMKKKYNESISRSTESRIWQTKSMPSTYLNEESWTNRTKSEKGNYVFNELPTGSQHFMDWFKGFCWNELVKIPTEWKSIMLKPVCQYSELFFSVSFPNGYKKNLSNR